MVYYLLRVPNQGLELDYNIRLIILGTFKMLTKSGPLDPLFLTEIRSQIQEVPESVLCLRI